MLSQAILVSSPAKASLTFKGLTRKADSWPALERRCYTKLVTGCNFQMFSASICERHYTKKSSIHHKLHEINCTSAASEDAYIPEPNSEISKGLWIKISQKLDALYRFTRPHTIIGTIVGITSVSLLPVENVADLSPMFFTGLVKALVPALFMNIYVVGLNQLFDIEIDKINKPNLPLASGEFSVETGAVIVVASAVMSFVLGLAAQSPPLIYALVISFILGTAYSVTLPLLRWKQNAFLAASCILCVRAIVVQLAFFVHMQRYVLGRPTVLTKSVIFATAFMCFFTAVIALFKDIPDVDGDKDFGIQSFSIRLGQSNVFWLCIKLLLTAYGTAVLVGAFSSNTYWRLVTVLGHGLLATILWLRAQDLDIHNKTSITTFYMFIWKGLAIRGGSAYLPTICVFAEPLVSFDHLLKIYVFVEDPCVC